MLILLVIAAYLLFWVGAAALVERLGMPITVVEGSYDNIKITTPEDLAIGEMILKRRAGRMQGE